MAIKTERLRKTFGNFVAVDDVTFEVPPGQIFGFLGPNGAGKTTTIRILLSLLKPTSGSAYVLGYDIARTDRSFRQQIGYVSQKFSLYRDLTVGENLRFFGKSYGLYNAELRQRMDYVVEMAGLKGHEATRTSELSGGWAQRLALGAAIMHKPRLLFLDEPTAGVDPVSRREFWDLLYQLAQEGTTVFVTTHYMDEAEHCESVAFIYQGRLIAHGVPHSIITDTMQGKVVAFEPPGDPAVVIAQLRDAIQVGKFDAGDVTLFGATLHVSTTNPDSVCHYLVARGIVPAEDSLYIADPSLEDAFIKLVRQQDKVNSR